MRAQDDIDYTTLAWIKGELDETLKQARHALEAYVEDASDASQIRFCATYLHQVQGTLRMVELYAAAMVAEEMERLAGALLENDVAERDEAYAILMRGIMQLPDYLERLQTGHKDVPIVLLPLLNDLRAARGEKGLSEIELFTPDLGRELPANASGPAQPLPESDLTERAEQLRSLFQMSLLKWFRNDDVDATLARLTETCDKLVALTFELEARRLFWVTGGVLEALRAKAFEPSKELKQCVGKVEREIKRLADGGEKSFRTDPPHELTRNLLYFVAHAPTDHGRIGELREVFNLGALLPNQQEVEHARGSLAGHNRSLLDTVSGAIKEDLMRVKDALDLHLRNPGIDVAELSPQVDVLDRVGDTLGMLGLSVARRVVQEQRDGVQAIVTGTRAADEASLLDIAGALLYVEASLDEQVQHLGGAPATHARGEAGALPSVETRRVMQALIKEAQTNFTRAKQCFVGYIESSWDATQLEDAPALLDEVSGALRIIELPEAAGYLEAIGRFTERELLQSRRVPDVMQMEALADALASVEYFLEAQAEQRAGRDRILHTARAGLEKLGYWPVPGQMAHAVPAAEEPSDLAATTLAPTDPFAETDFDVTAAFVKATEAAASSEVDAVVSVDEPVVLESVSDAATAPQAEAAEPTPEISAEAAFAEPIEQGPVVGGFEEASEEIDEEIREVFVEEVEEEIENLGTALSVWAASPSDLDQLKSIRRVFHTLKGSGRLVGALALGELSWRVENMLNRVLDHTIQPTQAVVTLIRSTYEVLPELLGALKGERSVRTDLEAIKDVADRISAGEQVIYAPVVAAVEPEPVLETSVEIPEVAEHVDTAALDEDLAVEAVAGDVAADESADLEFDDEDSDRTTVAAIDNVLFEILKPEVSGHLDTVDAYLSAGRGPVTDELVRAVHTMNGAFAMTEVPIVTELTAPLENYLKRVLAQSGTPSAEGFQVLQEASDALRHVLIELDGASPRLTSLSGLAARILAERDVLPEATGPMVPVHTASEQDEVPELTSVVSLDIAEDAAHDEFVSATQDEIDTSEFEAFEETPEVSLDTAALDALGDQDITLSGVGMDGHAGEAAALLAREFMEDQPDQGVHAAEADALASQVPVAETFETAEDAVETADSAELDEGEAVEVVEAMDWLELDSTDFDDIAALLAEEATEPTSSVSDDEEYDAAEREDTRLDEAESDELELSESVDWLETEDAEVEEIVVASDEPLFDVVEHDLSQIDEEVDSAIEQASSEPAMPSHQEPVISVSGASEVDALIRGWLASETGVADEEVPDAAVKAGALASTDSQDDEAPETADPSLESSDAHDGVDEASAVEDEAQEQEPTELADAGSTVSADTFFETFADGLDEDESSVVADEAEVSDVEALAETDADLDIASAEEAAEDVELAAESAEAGFEDEESVVLEDELEDEREAQEAELESVEIFEAVAVEEDDDAEDELAATELAMAPPLTEHEALIANWFVSGLEAADPDPDGPLKIADMDEELLDIFVEEATDILDNSDGLMTQLRRSIDDREAVVALQRDLHTLKGGARMAGVYAIGDLGHVMESLLEIVADGKRKLPRYGIDVLDVAFDRLNRLTARVASRQALAMPTLLVQRVEMLVRGDEPELVDQLVAEADQTEIAEVATVAVESTPAVMPDFVPTALDDEDITVRAPQEQVRIRADLLDRLVNYAGEVAIYRARLEQQLGLFRSNLTELEMTTERLRGQLRKLEIETEAQIVARYQREAEVGAEEAFDPLELDRFSTLQQLSRALSESAADLVSLQGTLEDHTRQYETLLLQQSRVSSDLQEGLMRTRMVPFDSLVPRLRRIIRQTSSELGKKAQLRVEGTQGEMDRSVLDRMTAPLEHMLRNAIAHGLEIPEERRALGKPEEGSIRIIVSREGSEVVIKITDDGRGLDREAIRRKAIDRGLLTADAEVSDQTLYGYILESGFSTASSVSKVAGRGVGMDVVHSEIRQLGGMLWIDSERGKGTVFTVRLPFTLAVTQAVFVQQGETSYAVPISSVQGVSRIDRPELDAQLATGDPRFVYAGEDYAIHDMGRLLGQADTRAEDSLQVPLLLARSGDLRVAICVDNVIGSREIVVKPVGSQVSSIPGIFGATIMGDGRVIVILDVAPLARRYTALHVGGVPEPIAPAAPARHVPLVMVVDDSITMRKVAGRVLERHGYEVLTAKDGVDAIEKLADRVPDVMLLDIEMPRMDGYELATHMKNDVRLRDIPIIMITSRTGEKHRQRAFEIGVDRYLGKPYQESDLMRNVEEILEVKRGNRG